MKTTWRILILMTCHFLSASSVKADFNEIESGTLLLHAEGSAIAWVAPNLSQDVAIDVTGPVVRTVVTQAFTNPGTEWANATYVFPLPENAAVDHMRMEIGERIIDGQIKEKTEAKKIYEKAKQQGKKASLLRQQRNNLFTTKLANLGPGETVKIRIEYQHAVDKNGDIYSLRFPMTLTPRYIPGQPVNEDSIATAEQQNGDIVADARDISPPWAKQGDNRHPTRITVDLQPGFVIGEVESLYHQIQQHQASHNSVSLTLDQSAHQANADFVLQWQAIAQPAPQPYLFSERHEEEDYHLLMVSPPAENLIDTISARELVFVIDTSGSMGGESLRQAKRALRWSLDRLREEDYFNIIEFNSGSWSLFGSARPATVSHIEKAAQFVDHLEARGGTEMRYALEMALCGFCSTSGRLRQVVFLTDGAVANEDQLFDLIRHKIGNSRLFTIGIGSAPNSFFMRKSAETGRGTFTHIGKIEESAEVMAQLFTVLEKPLITDLGFDVKTGNGLTWLPNPLPDVYAGKPIVAMLKGPLPPNLTVSGNVSGERWHASIDTSSVQQRKGLHTLWGRQRIEQLMDEYRHSLEPTRREQLKKSVTETALQHHLVSAFTSLIAVDISPTRPASSKGADHTLANNSPKGSHFGLTKTATPATTYLLSGLLLCLLSLLGINRKKTADLP